jgi:endonuclease III
MDELRQRVPEMLERLDSVWMTGPWNPTGKPVDELVGTILSQNTSDANTHRAFTSLRSRFPHWNDVINASTDDLTDAIRSGGLSKQKAPRIQKVLAQMIDPSDEDANVTLLEQLRSMSPDNAMHWLTSFNGVGPKTAACVLMFAVGIPVVPVDTHVFRVSTRLGLIGRKTDANRAHDELVTFVPPADAYRFHVHFINHGRTVCRARVPQCTECVLNDLCQYWAQQQART